MGGGLCGYTDIDAPGNLIVVEAFSQKMRMWGVWHFNVVFRQTPSLFSVYERVVVLLTVFRDL